MLRDYQSRLKADVLAAWQTGAKNVLAVAPTGSGKTVLMADLVRTVNVPTCVIAHRQELVGQISLALAREQLPHRLICSRETLQTIVSRQVALTGRSWFNDRATVAVAGVDTLLRRDNPWYQHVRLWTIDEAHHVLPGNKWGSATKLFPNAIGLGVTATPVRADRKRLSDMFNALCVGPTVRDLIDRGHLSDYRIFVPPQSIDLANVATSAATGDYNATKLREESHRSTITGDIVRDYLRFAPGKLGITFVVDVETAQEVAAQFNAAGVRAEAVSAKTPDAVRNALIDKFVSGEIRQLVNVDLFGEGFDVPGVEVVSMGRPTQSYGLYIQQAGRGLRPAPGKTHAILIDHVGNALRHGLPDAVREWSLDDEDTGKRKRREDDEIPLAVCEACMQPRKAYLRVCPYCGHRAVPMRRDGIEHVAGDLVELSPEILAAMRGQVARQDGPAPDATDPRSGMIRKHWIARQEAQQELRAAIARWAGRYKHVEGLEDGEIYRLFYYTFGTDVMTAQTLGAADAGELTNRVNAKC